MTDQEQVAQQGYARVAALLDAAASDDLEVVAKAATPDPEETEETEDAEELEGTNDETLAKGELDSNDLVQQLIGVVQAQNEVITEIKSELALMSKGVANVENRQKLLAKGMSHFMESQEVMAKGVTTQIQDVSKKFNKLPGLRVTGQHKAAEPVQKKAAVDFFEIISKGERSNNFTASEFSLLNRFAVNEDLEAIKERFTSEQLTDLGLA
jgi:uncharacterized protein YoaH (UPF0181 family)